MKKSIKDLIAIKEKRTFLTRMSCNNPKCDGEYKYCSTNQFSDIFSSFFPSENKKITYEHSCSKCGDKKEFTNIYPMTTEYEIGIDVSNDAIATFIGNDIQKKIQPDLDILGVKNE
jgi:hypothetical protein